MTNVSAEIMSIGTEILLGELTDTNSVFIARILRDLGINVYMMISVGDNRKRIADALQGSMARADIVITCGGLGPTVDDMTRQAVADATERGLSFHQDLLDQIADRFRGFQVTMTENNRQQAFLPDNAIRIENPVGTAPAFIVEHEGKVVISLPGVPREMKFLMNEAVAPYLRQKYQLGIIKARTLKTAGIGESALDEMLGHDLLQNANPTIGLNAHMGQIDVRITAKAPSESEADMMILTMETLVRERVGRFVFGADADALEAVLVDFLQRHNLKVALVQAGLGDALGEAIRSIPGGEAILTASEVYTTPDDLRAHYQLALELSLRELAQNVVVRVAERTQADATMIAVSLPDVGEGADSVEATVIGLLIAGGVYRDRVYGFGGQSDLVQAWGRSWLFSNVWRMLKDKYDAN